ncbi:threonine-phosphate decarboxylase CobD [Roseivivax sediminis]|uniref:threonine-phosphate decarboxylase n=1 Tax=Roseivivax sediminis TaxID=936889 RepID=A0A1I1U7X9_9RHOB|nr:threonine-phosphate decarboxylase CobD [Roseivivax sediminis]SFD64010.1 L-threonine O-3-phosphate decarboxylase [Roseivivax sediminis]
MTEARGGMARDHGGDLDRAEARYGTGPWIDLSTGINPEPYPLPEIPPEAWATLPTARAISALEDAARAAYGGAVRPVALAGAQAAIQLVPRLAQPGEARVVGPTYNEHRGALEAQGWTVTEVQAPEDLAGADLGVVVNPNNPDGRRWRPEQLLDLRSRVGLLVVDESFADPEPVLSLCPHLAGAENLVVLRSFGKFYGLAGLRLGFALSSEPLADRLRALAGPWAANGPAISVGCAALADAHWREATCARLVEDSARLDALAGAAGWDVVGGTTLFRTYAAPDAIAAQEALAQGRVWSRIFPYSPHWIRLGLPPTSGWLTLEAAFSALR